MLALLATEEGNHATEGAKAVINPIMPEPSEMVWGAIAFICLYVLMRYVFLPKIQGTIDKRAAAIASDLEAAAAAQAQAKGATAELEDQLADVRAQAAAIIEEARQEADAERQRLIGRAEREITALRDVVESEVAREHDEALASIQSQVTDLAAAAASRVMSRPVSVAEAGPIVDRYMSNPN